MSVRPPGRGRASELETRALLVGVFMRALARVDLRARVFAALPKLPPTRARVRVIAIGKAAPAMAEGALARWPDRIEKVLVVLPDGTPAGRDDPRVELLRASHPLPDERSVAAAARALDLAVGSARDLVVALVSGGASSLACAPVAGVSLADKRDVVRALLASGASIVEVNTVRRHLSRIKGGGLTRAAAPGRVLALLAGDVIGGGARDIGSGPTVADATTMDDARRVLRRRAPELEGVTMLETLKPDEPAARRQRAKIIASPDDLARLVAEEMTREGFATRVLEATTADVASLAATYARLASELAPNSAIVCAAEPSLPVTSSSPGRGGRESHLAALVATRLPPASFFLAGASDGKDGSSDAAGAVVDASFVASIGYSRIASSIASFDTASLHEEACTRIRSAPTGINLADVHVLARGDA